MNLSSTSRYLSGKTLPGKEVPVSAVYWKGNKRVVVFKDGSTETTTKTKLKNAFIKVLSVGQKQAMAQTLTRHKDGTASVVIGGNEKGLRKTYVSEQGAKRALDRYYGR